MIQVNLTTKQNRLTDTENRLVVVNGEAEGWTGSLGLADANYYM